MNSEREVIYSVAMSLDGFIAGPRGEYDWIPSQDLGIDFAAFVARFDTMLMGRKTFQLTLEQGPESQIPGMKRYVFSSTVTSGEHPEVTVVPPDGASELVRRLKSEPGKSIWLFGGSHLCASLVDAGLVDVVEVAVIPILLGEGIPLLQSSYATHELERVETMEYQRGVLLSTYRVVGSSGGARGSGSNRGAP